MDMLWSGPTVPATRVDAILREAAREFDAPIALISQADETSADPALRQYASASVLSQAGERLGTLCILGAQGNGPPSPGKLIRLREMARRTAAALERRG